MKLTIEIDGACISIELHDRDAYDVLSALAAPQIPPINHKPL